LALVILVNVERQSRWFSGEFVVLMVVVVDLSAGAHINEDDVIFCHILSHSSFDRQHKRRSTMTAAKPSVRSRPVLLCLLTWSLGALAFSPSPVGQTRDLEKRWRHRPSSLLRSSAFDVTATTDESLEATDGFDSDDTIKRLQTQLLGYGASYNRGFGASPRARREVDDIIRQLESKNQETNAARGISGNNDRSNNGYDYNYETRDASTSSPLKGAWRMIWTTALDVLSLEANPFVTTGAIYQVFDPPIITNVIDLLPSFQSLLPPSLLPISSLLRANVKTRAYQRSNQPNRIGLEFRSVQLQPVQALGVDVLDRLPPLGIDLPSLPGVTTPSDDGPGYFDVTFLDDELLIIRQQGDGLFCLVKVDSIEP
jgi:hypothetical protein